MRLLSSADCRTFKDFSEIDVPPYAVLSHCWNQGQEVTHQTLLSGQFSSTSSGWRKIERCCRIAASRGLDWVWIDTCCIDKTSSAELSETINSMWAWYEKSTECYVFLNDVDMPSTRRSILLDLVPSGRSNAPWRPPMDQNEAQVVEHFTKTVWFRRGWTLQELLAPDHVLFFDKHSDESFGNKHDLGPIIEYATGIGVDYISGGRHLSFASVAQRMSWASGRETTRPEDRAYSLLGIFDIHMPLIYGEGARAFERLQHEIIRTINDETIFAWGDPNARPHHSPLLAHSPEDFYTCLHVRKSAFVRSEPRSRFAVTSQGVQVRLRDFPLIRVLYTGWRHDALLRPTSYFRPSAATRLGIILQARDARETSGPMKYVILELIRPSGQVTFERYGVSTLTLHSVPGRLHQILVNVFPSDVLHVKDRWARLRVDEPMHSGVLDWLLRYSVGVIVLSLLTVGILHSTVWFLIPGLLLLLLYTWRDF